MVIVNRIMFEVEFEGPWIRDREKHIPIILEKDQRLEFQCLASGI